jgi:hypothetical protein
MKEFEESIRAYYEMMDSERSKAHLNLLDVHAKASLAAINFHHELGRTPKKAECVAQFPAHTLECWYAQTATPYLRARRNVILDIVLKRPLGDSVPSVVEMREVEGRGKEPFLLGRRICEGDYIKVRMPDGFEIPVVARVTENPVADGLEAWFEAPFHGGNARVSIAGLEVSRLSYKAYIEAALAFKESAS